MTEQAKVPAICFTGFTDPWEQRKLENLASFDGGHTPSMTNASNYADGKVLWVTSQDVKQHYIENTMTMISEKGAATLVLYPSDSIVIIARSGILRHMIPATKLRKSATVNQDTEVIQTADSCDSSRSSQYFIVSNKTLLRECDKTGTIAKSIDFAKMKSTTSMVSYIEKQRVIGSFFSRPNNLITLHRYKYDKLVIFEKSAPEKMFPKGGESVPEICFADFTDPWGQRKLGEIVSIGAGAPPSAFSTGNFLYVKADDLDESSHFQFDSAQGVDANIAVKPIRKGSIILAKRGAAVLGDKVRVLGKTAYIDTNMMALEPKGVDVDLLRLFINRTGLYWIADISTIPQINNGHIEPYLVDIPDMAEQQAVGTFFSRLDDLTTLH